MSSFWNSTDEQNKQDGSALQAPVTAGTTTREQFSQPTGASTGPVSSGAAAGASGGAGGGAAAPGAVAPAATSGNSQAAGKAPAWTNLMTFLGAQSPGEAGTVGGTAIKGAQDATNQTTAATTAANTGVQKAVTAGTNTGYVGKPVFATSSGPEDNESPSVVTPGKSNETTAPPSYDVSHVNLAGYTGPSTDQASQKFGAANTAAVNAQTKANGLKTGQVSSNAYDNAVLTQSPNWSRVLNTVSGANQAAQNAGAAANGAQENVAQAQRASGASAAQQKADLGTAQTALTANATANAKSLGNLSTSLSSGTVAGLSTALNSPGALAQIGLTPAQVQQLQQGLQNGSLSTKNVQDALAPYVAAAKGGTGYTAGSAAQTNQINGLLKNGQPAATATIAGTGSTDMSGTATQNKQDVNDINRYYAEQANYGGSAVKTYAPAAIKAIKDLIDSQGYTAEQVAQMSGLPVDQVKLFESAKKT